MGVHEAALQLPSPAQIRRAVELYLERAFPHGPTDTAVKLIPPQEFDPADWLMNEPVERDPADAPLEQVRSFMLRLGNEFYPHMKLRISRPPRASTFVFSVDSHDAFLHAPPGSADYNPLEQLKQHNSRLADDIHAAWDAGSLPTERSYLREKLQQAREAKESKP